MPLVITVNGEELLINAELITERDHRLLAEAIDDLNLAVYRRAVEKAPKRTGKLAKEGINRTNVHRVGNTFRSTVSLGDHPIYTKMVHRGTGVFGPHHSPIFSPHGNVMTFKIDGRWIRARSIKGQMPQPFLWEAVVEVEETILKARVKVLGSRLGRLPTRGGE